MKNLVPVLLATLITVAVVLPAEARAPRLPWVPSVLRVPAGHRISFRAFAEGVQIYTAIPSPDDPAKLTWATTAPEEVLFEDEGGIVASHYALAGSTRRAEGSSRYSRVVARRMVPPVTVDPTAIPWLRLAAARTEGAGILRGTTFIQRLGTTGGLAPRTPPAAVGQQIRVPYTAEYVFYRSNR